MADPCIARIQPQTPEDATAPAEYVRQKLNLAVRLACEGEHERRSGRGASAEGYQRQWEEVMAEVQRLLPLVRKSGVSLFATEKPERPDQKDL